MTDFTKQSKTELAMPLMLPKPEVQPSRPVRPRRVVVVEAAD